MIVSGSLIREMRLGKKLTQSQLAKMVGVSQAHIAKIEGGKVDPRLSTVNRILKVLSEKKGTKCVEVMTVNIIVTKPNESIGEASKIMIKNNISQLPVLQEDKILGIVTEEGIVRNLGPNMAEEPVSSVMESSLPMVSEDTDISTVRPLLETHSGVLIMKKGKLVGIITRSDLLKAI